MEDAFRGLLSRYHDGELDDAGARALSLHLKSCTECRAELATLRSLSQSLATARPEGHADERAAAEAFWKSLQPRLGVQTPAPPWLSWLPGLILLGLQALLALAGALLTLGPLMSIGTGAQPWLPSLPLPGPFSLGVSWSALVAAGALTPGVLYLVWLALWWSRQRTKEDLSLS